MAPIDVTKPGEIITFYSYKGGTGRTMALANTACLLAREHADRSRRVLMMDWDFEAPGLHRFFANRIVSPDQAVEPHRAFDDALGTLDLFQSVLDRATDSGTPPPDASDDDANAFVTTIDVELFVRATNVPKLVLMKAGRMLDDDEYAARVNRFDWEAFYMRFPWLFRALARRLSTEFSYVLIDSRTGLTDTSGICSMLMPSRLVATFTPGRQSLIGLAALVRRAVRYRRLSDDPRPLAVFPLPSRIENSEETLKRLWRTAREDATIGDGYQPIFERAFEDAYGLERCDLNAYFDKVAIQHVPFFAYGESIAVENGSGSDRLSLRESYRAFVERLVELASPWDDLDVVRKRQQVAGLVQAADTLLNQPTPDVAQAEAALIEAEGHVRSMQPLQDLGVVPALRRAAHTFESLADSDGEFRLLNRALQLEEAVLGASAASHPRLLPLLKRLAEIHRSARRFSEALALATRAERLAEEAFGADDPKLADILTLVGQLRSDVSDVQAGRDARRRADSIRRSAGAATPRHLRIFISSPGDVAAERAIAREVLDRLPRDPLLKGDLTIEVVSWDDPASSVPMFAELTPQQAVDRGLPQPSHCDLTVVILWGRMGTPLAEPRKPDGSPYLSGTEYEFEDARAAGKPVLVYRRTGSIPVTLDDPDLETKRTQKTRVDQFFERFKNSDGSLASGFNAYEDPQGFRQKFEAHVKAVVKTLLDSGGDESGRRRSVSRQDSKPVVPADYRQWLQARCAGVELLGLRLKQGQAVRLNNVYVPLTTTSASALEEDKRLKRRRTTREEPESATLLLELVGETSAYVSGDPGSGKSTFCRWLTWLACEGAVPPTDIETPEEFRERLPPALTNRLAVLVPLREVWPRLTAHRDRLSPDAMVSTVAGWLEDRGAPSIDEDLLSAHSRAGSGLFVFDGIDEVPPAERRVLLRALADARDAWTRPGNRLIVTSRPYGLTDGEIRELGLPQAPIQPLPDGLQWLLVRRWFGILSDNAEDANQSADKMLRQVREQAWLSPLTANPLLLTGMCIVFGDGKGLPEDKYELYDRVADAVLYNRVPDRQRQQLVRARLAVVAHGMHTGEGLGETRAAPQAEVTHKEIDRMLRAYQDRSLWTEQHVQEISEARDELVTQTGVLLPRGEQHAAFLHLSFQEFLAAQRMADVEADRIRDVFLERSGAPEWRNTLSFLFGSLIATSTTPERAVRLLTDLVGRDPASIGLILVAADAAEILLRRGLRLASGVDEQLRKTCVAAMGGKAPARDRALVGAALGRIGDPRFRADQWYLPADERLGFVEIPQGPFTMGSDKKTDKSASDYEQPISEVKLPAYFIGKWPVTVSQFKAFVDDAENGGFVPGNPKCVRGIGNHPVVYVSWHEAVAYCRWLTTRLRSSEATWEPLRGLLRGAQGRPWQVTLASEAEWEKAARGTDGRVYPWLGDEPDPNRANYAETGIGGPSAMGCFPTGQSVYEVEELSGNVWEWTRSIWAEYPYEPDYEGRSRESLAASGPRVVRGGAFNDDPRHVRAAYRLRDDPDDRNRYIGFRVVVSPFSSDL